MASSADTKLVSTLYNVEKKSFTWETYVWIHTEQHTVLNGLKEYGYSGIDDCSKVQHFMKGINTTELDVCKANTMASPTLRAKISRTVEPYSTFIKQTKAENTQMNVSEANYSKNIQGSGNTYSGNRVSSGISNSNQRSSTNAAVDDRFYENHEYLALSYDQQNTLCLKYTKCGHVTNMEKGGNHNDGKGEARSIKLQKSNLCIGLLRRFPPSLIISTSLMIMINPLRKRRVPLTFPITL
jgi:hypothetical protein